MVQKGAYKGKPGKNEIVQLIKHLDVNPELAHE
jgi:hypothetical protein